VKLKIDSHTKEILAIAAPVTAQSLFNTLMHAVDSKMVSSLGISRIAAVSYTNSPRLFVFALFFAMNTVITILVSEKLGKNKKEDALKTIKTALLLVTIVSLLFGLMTYLFRNEIMSLFVKEAQTLKESAQYFGIVMFFSVFTLLSAAVNAVNVAIKKSVSVLNSSIMANIINILFDYLLIDGHLGLPAFGVKGAAFATIIGQIFGLIVSLYYFVSNKTFSLKDMVKVKTEFKDSTKEIFRLWKNVCLSDISERAGLFILAIINAKAGTLAYSVYTIGNYYLNVNFAVGKGLSTSSLALISRNRDNREAVKNYIRSLVRIYFFLTVLFIIVYPLSGLKVFTLYSDNELFVNLGRNSVLLIASVTPFHIISVVSMGVLNSIKDNLYVSKVALISMLLVECTVSYIFVVLLEMGVYGIWVGCISIYLVESVCYILRIRKKSVELLF